MKKRILVITLLLVIVLLFFEIAKTYSLFETNGNGEISSNLATWEIYVNNTDVTKLNGTNTFNLASINWGEQNHVIEGKGAPGSVGTFNILIVPGNTQVSFTYELTFDFSNLNNSEFQVSEIKDLNGSTLIRTGENSYTGIVTLNDINSKKTYNIEVSIVWNNNEENNDNDYNLGVSAIDNINIPVEIKLLQYNESDQINEYVPEESG